MESNTRSSTIGSGSAYYCITSESGVNGVCMTTYDACESIRNDVVRGGKKHTQCTGQDVAFCSTSDGQKTCKPSLEMCHKYRDYMLKQGSYPTSCESSRGESFFCSAAENAECAGSPGCHRMSQCSRGPELCATMDHALLTTGEPYTSIHGCARQRYAYCMDTVGSPPKFQVVELCMETLEDCELSRRGAIHRGSSASECEKR